jgi:hydrogenase nickel incorporation protein HypB
LSRIAHRILVLLKFSGPAAAFQLRILRNNRYSRRKKTPMKADIRAECDAGKQTEINHAVFRELGVTAISIFSEPRAGKTTILERTLPLLKNEFNVAVLETDLQPSLDACRIRSAGVPVWQIVTGIDNRAHAGMVAEALRQFPLAGTQVLFIERLIDPDDSSTPDWGEDLRVMVYRPSPNCLTFPKMPDRVLAADAVVLNTMDCGADRRIVEKVTTAMRAVNPNLPVFGSCRTQANLTLWVSWLRQRIHALQAEQAVAAHVVDQRPPINVRRLAG